MLPFSTQALNTARVAHKSKVLSRGMFVAAAVARLQLQDEDDEIRDMFKAIDSKGTNSWKPCHLLHATDMHSAHIYHSLSLIIYF
jgi:hypothetical protein